MTEPSPLPRSPQSSATAPSAPPSPPSAGGGWTDVLLAVVFYLLLIDAAAETFLGGSPVRWWLVGVAAIYLSVTVLVWRMAPGVWRRLTWSPLATITLAVLLGVLAGSTWLPGGTTQGVRLVGQPTSTVLSALTLIAVALAGWTLARLRVLPVAVRGVAVALAAYAGAAFVLAIVGRLPFVELFHGRSLLARLPVWLQGATLGSVLLLPVALMAAVARLLGSLRRRAPANTLPAQALTLGAALVLVVVTFQPSPQFAGPANAANQGGRSSTAEATAQGTSSRAFVSATLEEIAEPLSLSRDATQVPEQYRVAIADLRSKLDAARLDVGACQALLGNDPETLRRFVQEEISFEPYEGVLRGARGALLARGGNAADRALLLAALLKAAGLQVRLARGELSAAQAEVLLSRSLAFRPPMNSIKDDLRDRIIQSAEGHFNLIGDTLYASGFPAPKADGHVWQQALRDSRSHAWVQFQDHARWVDLDPTSGLIPGWTTPQPTWIGETFDPQLVHTVDIAIEIETIRGTQPTRQFVLQHRIAASDLAGVPVGLFHLIDGERATPVLVVGDRAWRGLAFVASETPEGSSEGIFPLAGPDAGRPGHSPITGEWLHIRVAGLSGSHQATYTVADAMGPAARAASTPTPATIDPADLGTVLGIAVVSGAIPPSLPAAILADGQSPASPIGVSHLLTTVGFAYGAIRAALPFSLIESTPPRWIDAPNIIITQLRTLPDGDVEVSLDLTLKSYRWVRKPGDALGPDASFYDAVSAGVLDHTVERAVVWPAAGARSVGSFVEAAADQGIPMIPVLPGTQAMGRALGADGKLRATDALRSGDLLVLPADRPSGWSAGQSGWWAINPKTGFTEDTSEAGGHQGMTERGLQERQTPSKIKISCKYGRAAMLVTLPLLFVFADPADAEKYSHLKDATDAIFHTICGAEEVGPKSPPRPSGGPRPDGWGRPPKSIGGPGSGPSGGRPWRPGGHGPVGPFKR